MIRWMSIAALILLTGCSSNPDSGAVLDKFYTPSHTYTSFMQVGKTTVPVVTVTPEKWCLLLKNGDTIWDECIDQEEWAKYTIGDSWADV